MWTPATRRQHSRAGLRYASDLTDAEWAVLAPLLPPAPRRGRRRAWPEREIVNAIFYVLRAGCAWRLLPDSFPPWRTVYRWFARLRDGGVLEALNHHLVVLDRERAGREASPTGAVIDSQSTKTTEAGGPRGYDAGKKVMGRKRHAMVDTDGRALVLHAHPGSVQDRDGAPPLLRASRRRWPFVELAFADAGYAGERVAAASPIRIEIVRKPKGAGRLPPSMPADGWLSDRGSSRQCLLCARCTHRRILVVSAVGPAGRRNMRLETVPRHVERAVRTNRPQDPTRDGPIRVPAGTPASASQRISCTRILMQPSPRHLTMAKPGTACRSSTWRAARRRSSGRPPPRRA
jgi:putative transposase